MEANQTVSGMVQIPTTVFHIPDEELNAYPWHESLVSIQTVNGFYLTQDNISREERLEVNSDLLKHQKMIAYISSKQNISQELHMLINKHYLNVTRLLKQYPENTPPE